MRERQSFISGLKSGASVVALGAAIFVAPAMAYAQTAKPADDAAVSTKSSSPASARA
jgi:hypothetical protein